MSSASLDPMRSISFTHPLYEFIDEIVVLTEIWEGISDQYADPTNTAVFLIFRQIRDRAQSAIAIIDGEGGL